MATGEYRRMRRAVIAAAVVGVLLTWAATVAWLIHERRQALEIAEDQLGRLSVIVAEQSHRLFSQTDLFLETMETAMNAEDAGWITGPAAAARIAKYHEQAEGSASVGVVDSGGTALILSGPAAGQLLPAGDRPYVLDARTGSLNISDPVKARLTGEWIVPLSRRIDPPIGDVAVMFTSLRLASLERLYDRIRPGAGGGVALVRADGMLLARAPHREDLVGRTFGGPLFKNHLPRSPEGLFTDISALDGTLRMVAYRTVPAYGLVLTISAGMDEVLALWRRDLMSSVLSAVAITAAIILGAAIILRLLGRLEASVRELDRRVRERTADLERAMEARSKFLASMSHELRTPLNAILGFSEALKTGAFGRLADPHLAYVQDIHTSGGLLLSLVNDLLDTAALDAGKLVLDESETDPGAVVADAASMMRHRAERAGIAVTIDLGRTACRVIVDRRRLLQAVLNILSNAVKYNRSGGWVRVSCVCDGGSGYVITIADNGPGMSKEVLELALVPFGRSADPAVRAVEGAGLGLPLAASLMELHGGALKIDSALGAGTTVSLHLPPERLRG